MCQRIIILLYIHYVMLLYLLQLHFPQENVSRPKYYMVHGKWENAIKCYHVIANNIF